MSEEKKILGGGLTPEQEDTLKEVAGGSIYDGASNAAVLDAQDQRYIQKSNECSQCKNLGKDACPYNSDIGSYWMGTQKCNSRSGF